MPKALDITNQVFNKLTALKRSPNKNGRTYWLCRCECGKEKEIRTSLLTSGKVLSCGCKRIESNQSRRKIKQVQSINLIETQDKLNVFSFDSITLYSDIADLEGKIQQGKITGIYKIVNKINNKIYIGQSVNITQRLNNHITTLNNPQQQSYDYPIYRAMRKYGLQNFNFVLIELCDPLSLDEREVYWIKHYDSTNPDYGYNISKGGKSGGNYVLTTEQVKDIIYLLKTTKMTQTKIAEKYSVNCGTISEICLGKTWKQDNEKYPLRRIRPFPRPDRHTLKNMIRNQSFNSISKELEIGESTVRKWCSDYGLPNTKGEIGQISDDIWKTI